MKLSFCPDADLTCLETKVATKKRLPDINHGTIGWSKVVCRFFCLAKIQTQLIDFGHGNKGKQVGFVGRVTLRILRARQLLQVDILRLNALANYAHFCGVGHRTTHGMGQTRREWTNGRVQAA